jgi:hypothetical protein
MVAMSSSEEDSYSVIYTSLKHPIKRKILRVLSPEAQSFSDLQKQFKLESPHLTYHIDGLGNLLYKTEDGKYALSSLGEAAVSMMKNVEEAPNKPSFPFTQSHSNLIGKKVAGRAFAIAVGLICIVLAATLVGAFAYYVPLVDSKNNTISSLNSQVSYLQNQAIFDNATLTNLQKQIHSLQSQIVELQNNVSSDNVTITNLQDQLNLTSQFVNLTGAVYVTVAELNLDPSSWVNKTVFVEGNLTYYWFTIEEIANGWIWDYQLSSKGNFWVLWKPDWVPRLEWKPSYDGVNAIIIGIVKQTPIYVSGSWVTAYYIDAEKIVPT